MKIPDFFVFEFCFDFYFFREIRCEIKENRLKFHGKIFVSNRAERSYALKQLSLGKKIKNLRLQKGMTQAELAGETITRNMLSQIENETAQPSVNTILELSERLDAPAEYFFSEISDPEPFYKLLALEKIRKAYAAKDYGKCIYRLDRLGVSDDETEYLYAQAFFGKAQDFYREGRFATSEEFFGKALAHAEKTAYIRAEFSDMVAQYLSAIHTVWKKEKNFVSDDTSGVQIKNLFSDMMYPSFLSGGQSEAFLRALDPLYAKHLLIHSKMQKEYSDAEAESFMQALRDILENVNEKEAAVLKYYVLCDLEVLAQKTGDYKCAYECASSRLALSEKMNT